MDNANIIMGLLNNLYDMVENAGGVITNSSKCVIDREQAKTIIDQALQLFPQEFAEAARLSASRREYVAHVRREAEAIMKTANDRSRRMVDEQEVLRIARAESSEMLAAAREEASTLRRYAMEYVDDKLRRSEEALQTALGYIMDSRRQFDERTGGDRDEDEDASEGADA